MEKFTLESPIQGFEIIESLLDLTLPEYLLQKANFWSEAKNERTDFIIDTVTGMSYNFCTFEEQTRKLASAFYKRGMRQYDTAIYMAYDMVNLPIFFTGVWRANGMVRATYPEDDADTLLSRVEESRVGWILCDSQAAEMCLSVAKQIYWDVEIIVIGEYDGCTSLSSLFEDVGDEIPILKTGPKDIAMILCTSGTTGRSKGAVHTHQNLIKAIEGMRSFFPFCPEKPNLIVSKGTHITGSLFPLTAIASGKTVLVMAIITKENVFNAVNDYKPGMIWGFPTFLLSLVNDSQAGEYDFTSLEIASSGGAPVTPAIENTLMQLPNLKCVINIYGLTEIVPICSCINYESGKPETYPDSPPFTIGKVYPGVSVQIRNITDGEAVGPHEHGEICAKSMYLFKGYYKNEDATNDAVRDGWFKTGDVGYYDENGFLFIVDRMKEIFKYYNNHISPTELEDVISQHPAVSETCVIGIPDPDGGDTIPRAFVTLKGESFCDADEISKFANERLPDYKKLRGGLFILKELPKGKTGKVTRQLVAELKIPEE